MYPSQVVGDLNPALKKHMGRMGAFLGLEIDLNGGLLDDGIREFQVSLVLSHPVNTALDKACKKGRRGRSEQIEYKGGIPRFLSETTQHPDAPIANNVVVSAHKGIQCTCGDTT